MLTEKSRFFLKNLARGIIWLGLIIFIFVLVKKNFTGELPPWFLAISENKLAVYLIFMASEIIFGIIPPEIFMIWGLQTGLANEYIKVVIILAGISYGAGIIGYLFGNYLYSTRLFKYLRKRYQKLEKTLNTYGLYLIVVAALTPIPFSAVCMLVGSVEYPVKKFLGYSLFRFVRFGVYSWLIWKANMI